MKPKTEVTPKRASFSTWEWPLVHCEQRKKEQEKKWGAKMEESSQVEWTDGGEFRGREEVGGKNPKGWKNKADWEIGIRGGGERRGGTGSDKGNRLKWANREGMKRRVEVKGAIALWQTYCSVNGNTYVNKERPEMGWRGNSLCDVSFCWEPPQPSPPTPPTTKSLLSAAADTPWYCKSLPLGSLNPARTAPPPSTAAAGGKLTAPHSYSCYPTSLRSKRASSQLLKV